MSRNDPEELPAVPFYTYLKNVSARHEACSKGPDDDDDDDEDDDRGVIGDAGKTDRRHLERLQLSQRSTPTLVSEVVPVSEVTRGDSLAKPAKGVWEFIWNDADLCRWRCVHLVEASLQHTGCGSYCMRGGLFRFGFPKAGTVDVYGCVSSLELSDEQGGGSTDDHGSAKSVAAGGGRGGVKIVRPVRQSACRPPGTGCGGVEFEFIIPRRPGQRAHVHDQRHQQPRILQ